MRIDELDKKSQKAVREVMHRIKAIENQMRAMEADLIEVDSKSKKKPTRAPKKSDALKL